MANNLVRFKVGKVRMLEGEPKAFVNDPKGGVVYDMERRLRTVAGIAKLKCNVRTGLLLTTIRTRTNLKANGWPTFDVIAGKSGARTVPVLVDQGSPPHVIRARRKKALRFVVNGQVRFATKVNHPGYRGSGFLTKSLEAAAH
jgi:hypothetical protein